VLVAFGGGKVVVLKVNLVIGFGLGQAKQLPVDFPLLESLCFVAHFESVIQYLRVIS
jgi:hypothetical protein